MRLGLGEAAHGPLHMLQGNTTALPSIRNVTASALHLGGAIDVAIIAFVTERLVLPVTCDQSARRLIGQLIPGALLSDASAAGVINVTLSIRPTERRHAEQSRSLAGKVDC